MPGVPSGRGCNACRRQKKKCDITVYPCPRCARLNIPCIGLGEKRYKFVNDGRSSLISVRPHPRTVTATLSFPSHDTTIFRALSNEHTWRVSAFTDKLKPSIGVNYNLAWTFGAYFLDIPARLGTNEALDRAVDAVLAAFDRFSSSLVNATPVLLEKYAVALAALRRHSSGRLRHRPRVILKGRPSLLDNVDAPIIVTSSKAACCLEFVHQRCMSRCSMTESISPTKNGWTCSMAS